MGLTFYGFCRVIILYFRFHLLRKLVDRGVRLRVRRIGLNECLDRLGEVYLVFVIQATFRFSAELILAAHVNFYAAVDTLLISVAQLLRDGELAAQARI